MKKFILATTAFVALTAGSVMAADMGVKAPAMARSACAQFGGAYIGVNGGWAYHDKSWVDRDTWVDNFNLDWALGTVNSTRNGATAGGQAGYNWQRGCTLFGIEIDGNWAGLSNSKTYSPSASAAVQLTLSDKLNWFGTARTRTGLIVDDLLLYVTGGAAYASIKHDFTIVDAVLPTTEAFGADKGRWGWVGGVGAEWAMTNSVSIKTEALYVKFSERTTTVLSTAGTQNVRFDHQDSMWVSRVGINFKFGAR